MKMRHRLPLLVSAAILAVTGCGTGDDGGSGSDGRLSVATSFYPLQHAAEQVGGEHVEVTNLTKPGAEPHDLELSPKQVASVQDADLVVYQDEFQTAVEALVLAATDPANPYGAALDWPAVPTGPDGVPPTGQRPGRKAGAIVVLADVLIRRRDLGRRRTLGIGRADLVLLVAVRTAAPAVLGAVVGAGTGYAVVVGQGGALGLDFVAGVAVLAALTAVVASLLPAAFAAFRDPVRVMRTA